MDDLGRPRIRKPGNKVVRRRVESQQVMELPPPPRARKIPSVHSNAKRLAFAYSGLVVLGASLLSTPLASEHEEWTPFVDSLFTAVSATSVTGLVTVDTQDHWNLFGEMLVLLMIQLGGLGFMVGASLVLLTMRRSSSLRGNLIMRDGGPSISLREARQLSRRILRFMLVAEAIGAIILTIGFLPTSETPLHALWFGMFYSISAFCNAGFDLEGNFSSLSGYEDSVLINLTLMSLIQLGALSYMVFGDLWANRSFWQRGSLWSRRFWRRLTLDTKLVIVTNYALISSAGLIFMIVEWNAALATINSSPDRVMGAFFQSVAARTAGFATFSFDDAHAGTLFFWVALMMIGGASGSTAGGVKLTTFAVIVLAITSTLRGETEPQVYGRRIPVPLVFRAITIVALFLMVHFALTLLLVLTEDLIGDGGFSFLSLMFETMSGLATVGVSTGITPDLTTAGKLVLCAAMFIGRLGPLTAMYALQRRETERSYTYPETYVRLG